MRERVSRVREGGTVVTVPLTGEQRIGAFRSIVANKQYAKIDGCMIDLFSAGYVVQVYDALSEANQTKYAAMPAPVMVSVAFKVAKKVGS